MSCNFRLKAGHDVFGKRSGGNQAFSMKFYVNLARIWAVFAVRIAVGARGFPLL